jgi:hypothetical protein
MHQISSFIQEVECGKLILVKLIAYLKLVDCNTLVLSFIQCFISPLALRLIGTSLTSSHFFVPLISLSSSFHTPFSISTTTTITTTMFYQGLLFIFHLEPLLHSLDNHFPRETPLEMEKSQPKERERATEMTMSSLHKLHKTNSLVIGTLHFCGC